MVAPEHNNIQRHHPNEESGKQHNEGLKHADKPLSPLDFIRKTKAVPAGLDTTATTSAEFSQPRGLVSKLNEMAFGHSAHRPEVLHKTHANKGEETSNIRRKRPVQPVARVTETPKGRSADAARGKDVAVQRNEIFAVLTREHSNLRDQNTTIELGKDEPLNTYIKRLKSLEQSNDTLSKKLQAFQEGMGSGANQSQLHPSQQNDLATIKTAIEEWKEDIAERLALYGETRDVLQKTYDGLVRHDLVPLQTMVEKTEGIQRVFGYIDIDLCSKEGSQLRLDNIDDYLAYLDKVHGMLEQEKKQYKIRYEVGGALDRQMGKFSCSYDRGLSNLEAKFGDVAHDIFGRAQQDVYICDSLLDACKKKMVILQEVKRKMPDIAQARAEDGVYIPNEKKIAEHTRYFSKNLNSIEKSDASKQLAENVARCKDIFESGETYVRAILVDLQEQMRASGLHVDEFLTRAENENGFQDRVPVTEQLDGVDFSRIMLNGSHMLDVGAGEQHGAHSHRLQWYVLYQAHRDGHLDMKPIEMYKEIGHFSQRFPGVWNEVFDQVKPLWWQHEGYVSPEYMSGRIIDDPTFPAGPLKKDLQALRLTWQHFGAESLLSEEHLAANMKKSIVKLQGEIDTLQLGRNSISEFQQDLMRTIGLSDDMPDPSSYIPIEKKIASYSIKELEKEYAALGYVAPEALNGISVFTID